MAVLQQFGVVFLKGVHVVGGGVDGRQDLAGAGVDDHGGAGVGVPPLVHPLGGGDLLDFGVQQLLHGGLQPGVDGEADGVAGHRLLHLLHREDVALFVPGDLGLARGAL